MLHRLFQLFSTAIRTTAKPIPNTASRELHVQELEGRVVPAGFDFAMFNWDDDNTPDLLNLLNPGVVPDGFGAIITNVPNDNTSIVNFPNPPVDGFQDNLTIGNLAFGIPTTASPDGDEGRALNLPGNDSGTADRSGFALLWSGGRLLPNLAGDDFVVYESASNMNTPEGFMVQVHSASTNTWSRWRYEAADRFAEYNPAQGGQGAFATAYDLSDFGLASTEVIDQVRIVNMTDEDRMEDASRQGFVLPEDNGATSTFFPDPGPLASFTMFGGNTLDPDPLFFASLQTIETPAAGQPDLSITKTDGLSEVGPGQTTTYTIVVTNNSTFTATGANVVDNFPPQLTNVFYTSTVTDGATGNTANGTGNIDDLLTLPAGSTVTYTVNATVALDATGTIANTARIINSAAQPDPIPANNTATDTNTVTNPEITITKTDGVTQLRPGESTLYQIVVRNRSDFAVAGVNVVDNFPTSLNFVSYTSTTSVAGVTGNTTAGVGNINDVLNLPANSLVTYTVFARAGLNAAGTIENTATVTLPDPLVDANPANNTATDTNTVVQLPAIHVVGGDQDQVSRVLVFDAATGETKFDFQPYITGFTGGVRVAVGDINGDFIPDIITGAGPGGGPHVKVFDGQTGDEIRSFFAYTDGFTGGVFVAAGDVNGDGITDIITGAGAGGGPHVRIFSGDDLSIINEFFVFPNGFTGGVRVASGDVNDDGFADLVMAAGPGGGPHVRVFGGGGAGILGDFFAYQNGFTGGVFVAVGDTNGDGLADVITGAGEGGGPHVKVLDSAFDLFNPLTLLNEFFAYEDDFSGGVRVAATDVNADGLKEVVTGEGPPEGPQIKIFNNDSRDPVDEFFAFSDDCLDGGPCSLGVFVG